MPVRDRILVTGASGFLGSHVTRDLIPIASEVRGLVRTGMSAPGVHLYRTPDLSDQATLDRALAGVDTVIHLAARVHVMRDTSADPLADYRRVNVEGTRTLLDRCRAAGVRRFIFASSVKAVGEESSIRWTETTLPRPVDPYGISKLEAEQVVRHASEEYGLDTAIIRLPLIYGAGVGGNMLRLFQLVDRGIPLPCGGIHNLRSMVYVGNVGAAIVALLESGLQGHNTYFLSDGHDVSTPELLKKIASALDRPARVIPVPWLLIRAGGYLGDVINSVRPFPLTSATVQRLGSSLTIDMTALTHATGFRPPFTVDAGLAYTAQWYRRTALRSHSTGSRATS